MSHNLQERIEAALSAADDLADAARQLNDGPNSERMAELIKAYTQAARGLDLRAFAMSEPDASLRSFDVTISFVDRVSYECTRTVQARDDRHAAELLKAMSAAGRLDFGDAVGTDTEPYQFEVKDSAGPTTSWQEDN